MVLLSLAFPVRMFHFPSLLFMIDQVGVSDGLGNGTDNFFPFSASSLRARAGGGGGVKPRLLFYLLQY